jgi:hypothetical protein
LFGALFLWFSIVSVVLLEHFLGVTAKLGLTHQFWICLRDSDDFRQTPGRSHLVEFGTSSLLVETYFVTITETLPLATSHFLTAGLIASPGMRDWPRSLDSLLDI